MNRKRTAASGAIALMLTLLLSGCGEEPSPVEQAAESAPPKTQASDEEKSSATPSDTAQAEPPATLKAQQEPVDESVDEPLSVNPLTGEEAPSEPAQSKTLDLSLTEAERLGEQPAAEDGLVNGLMPPEDEPESAFKRALEASEEEDGVSFSGGLITKEDEPNFRDSVEGAEFGLEVKY
ncbi:hypothetical protein [Motiliproteus sp.]|uniref:hypothetical protein n=1 Tax=Motiliproteus sp. TaxID=1898955 RepID=UPI003BA8BCC3